MPITDVKAKALKPALSTQKVSDGGGLQLWVTPAGGKIWKLAYRHGGAQKTLTIGPYPAIGIAEARKRRDTAKALLVDGLDPSQQKRAAKTNKAVLQTNTFALVASELVAKKKREGKAPRTIEKIEWLLSYTVATIGPRSIAEISAGEILTVLQALEKRGTHEAAKRLRGLIGEVFRFAVATARATHDPSAALRGALTIAPVKHHAALTDRQALGGLLRAIDGFTGQQATRAGLQLLALLACRPGELRQATWPEFDLINAIWIIPAARMKMRKEHKTPLPRQAIKILEALKITSRTLPAGLVLPSTWTVDRPMSENTLNGAIRRLGFTNDEATSHGFRATFSSIANESGLWPADAIERQLAHVDRNAVRRAYARGEHWQERVALMNWWANELDALRRATT